MKTIPIGFQICSRCHGEDPNCSVCQVTDEEEDEILQSHISRGEYQDGLADYLMDEMKDRE